MPCVKTAVSIERSLFEQTKELAKEMNVSRSKLVSLALEQFFRKRRQDELARRINEAYADFPNEEERAFLDLSASSLAEAAKDDEW